MVPCGVQAAQFFTGVNPTNQTQLCYRVALESLCLTHLLFNVKKSGKLAQGGAPSVSYYSACEMVTSIVQSDLVHGHPNGLLLNGTEKIMVPCIMISA